MITDDFHDAFSKDDGLVESYRDIQLVEEDEFYHDLEEITSGSDNTDTSSKTKYYKKPNNFNNNNDSYTAKKKEYTFVPAKQIHSLSSKEEKIWQPTNNDLQFYLLNSETHNNGILQFDNNSSISNDHFLKSQFTKVNYNENPLSKDVIFLHGKGKLTADNSNVKNIYAYVTYDHENYAPTMYIEAREGFYGFSYNKNMENKPVNDPLDSSIHIMDPNSHKIIEEDKIKYGQNQFIDFLQNFLTLKYSEENYHYGNPNCIVSYENVTNKKFTKSTYYYVPNPENGGPNRHILKLSLNSKVQAKKLITLFNSDEWLNYVHWGVVPTIRTFEGQPSFDLQWRSEFNIPFGKLLFVDHTKMRNIAPKIQKATFRLLHSDEDSVFLTIPFNAIRGIRENEKFTFNTLLPEYMDCSVNDNFRQFLPKKVFFDFETNVTYDELLSAELLSVWRFSVAKWTPKILAKRYSTLISSFTQETRIANAEHFNAARNILISDLEKSPFIEKKFPDRRVNTLVPKYTDTDEITIIAAVSRTKNDENNLTSDGGGIVFTWRSKERKTPFSGGLNLTTTKNYMNITIQEFPSELEMIHAFLDWLLVEKPSFLGGHNIRGFDLQYLYDRYDYLGGKRTNLLSIINNSKEIHYQNDFERGSAWKSKITYRINGLSIIDSLDGGTHETFGSTKGQPNDLSSLAGKLVYPGTTIPMRKLEIQIQKAKEMWVAGGDDLDHLIAYCFFDALLSCLLIEKWGIISNAFFVSTITAITPSEVYFRGVRYLHWTFNYNLIYNPTLTHGVLKNFIYPDLTMDSRELHQADLWYDHYDPINADKCPKDVRWLYEHDPFMKRRWMMGDIRRIPDNRKCYGALKKCDEEEIKQPPPPKPIINKQNFFSLLPVSVEAPKIEPILKKKTLDEILRFANETSKSPLPRGYINDDLLKNPYLPDVTDLNYIRYSYENDKVGSKRKKNFKCYYWKEEDGNGYFVVLVKNVLNQDKPFMGGHCFSVLRHVNYHCIQIILDYVSMYPNIAFSYCFCTSTMLTEKIKRMFGIKNYEVIKVTMGPSHKVQIGDVEKCKLQNQIHNYNEENGQLVETAYVYFLQNTDCDRVIYPKSIKLLLQSRKKAKVAAAIHKSIYETLEEFKLDGDISKIEKTLSNELKEEIRNKVKELSPDDFQQYIKVLIKTHKAKHSLYDIDQNSKKTCLNSSFGVQCKLIGGAITAIGRFTIQKCWFFLIGFDLLTVLLKNEKNLLTEYLKTLLEWKSNIADILYNIYTTDKLLVEYMNFERDYHYQLIDLHSNWNLTQFEHLVISFIKEIHDIYKNVGKPYSVFKSNGDTDSVIMFFPTLFLSPYFHKYIHRQFAPYLAHKINDLCVKVVKPSTLFDHNIKEDIFIIENDRINHSMEFEVDVLIASQTSQVQKKKAYIMNGGINEKTRQPIESLKGVASKKGDGVPFAVKLERESVFDYMLKPLNTIEVNELRYHRAHRVLDFIRTELVKLLKGNYLPKDFAVAVKLNKPVEKYEMAKKPDHVRVALKQISRGIKIETQTKIEYLYVMPSFDLLDLENTPNRSLTKKEKNWQKRRTFETSMSSKNIFDIEQQHPIDNKGGKRTSVSMQLAKVKDLIEERVPEAMDYVQKHDLVIDIPYYVTGKILPKMVKFLSVLLFNHESYLDDPIRMSLDDMDKLKREKKRIIQEQEKITENIIMYGEVQKLLTELDTIKKQKFTIFQKIISTISSSSSSSNILSVPDNLYSQCRHCGICYSIHNDLILNAHDWQLQFSEINENNKLSSQEKLKLYFTKIYDHKWMKICPHCFEEIQNPEKITKKQTEIKNNIEKLTKTLEDCRQTCWKCIGQTDVSVRSSTCLKQVDVNINNNEKSKGVEIKLHKVPKFTPEFQNRIQELLKTEEGKTRHFYTKPEDCQLVKCPNYIVKTNTEFLLRKQNIKLNDITNINECC